MTNRAKEVQEKIRNLIETREKTTADILEKIDAERRAECAAQEAIDKATAALDFEMNHKAQLDMTAATERRVLLQRRFDQLNSRKLVPEDESDKVISSLLQYEQDLADAFEKEVSAPIATIAKLFREYREKVQETERTIDKWTREIHPNYLRPGTMEPSMRRCPQPRPVHTTPYFGSVLSEQIDDFLDLVLPLEK